MNWSTRFAILFILLFTIPILTTVSGEMPENMPWTSEESMKSFCESFKYWMMRQDCFSAEDKNDISMVIDTMIEMMAESMNTMVKSGHNDEHVVQAMNVAFAATVAEMVASTTGKASLKEKSDAVAYSMQQAFSNTTRIVNWAFINEMRELILLFANGAVNNNSSASSFAAARTGGYGQGTDGTAVSATAAGGSVPGGYGYWYGRNNAAASGAAAAAVGNRNVDYGPFVGPVAATGVAGASAVYNGNWGTRYSQGSTASSGDPKKRPGGYGDNGDAAVTAAGADYNRRRYGSYGQGFGSASSGESAGSARPGPEGYRPEYWRDSAGAARPGPKEYGPGYWGGSTGTATASNEGRRGEYDQESGASGAATGGTAGTRSGESGYGNSSAVVSTAASAAANGIRRGGFGQDTGSGTAAEAEDTDGGGSSGYSQDVGTESAEAAGTGSGRSRSGYSENSASAAGGTAASYGGRGGRHRSEEGGSSAMSTGTSGAKSGRNNPRYGNKPNAKASAAGGTAASSGGRGGRHRSEKGGSSAMSTGTSGAKSGRNNPRYGNKPNANDSDEYNYNSDDNNDYSSDKDTRAVAGGRGKTNSSRRGDVAASTGSDGSGGSLLKIDFLSPLMGMFDKSLSILKTSSSQRRVSSLADAMKPSSFSFDSMWRTISNEYNAICSTEPDLTCLEVPFQVFMEIMKACYYAMLSSPYGWLLNVFTTDNMLSQIYAMANQFGCDDTCVQSPLDYFKSFLL